MFDLSIFLAKVLGLYMLIVGIIMILRLNDFQEIFMECIKKPAHVFFVGVISLIFGIILVVSHNIWAADWRIIITIIAWLTLLKGAARLFMAKKPPKWLKNMLENKMSLSIITYVMIIFGVYLTWIGFSGR